MPDAGLTLDADVLRVPVGSGALHVDRYGQGGEAVVLLHGFGTSSFLWRTVAPEIATCGHTALAVDLLGYGESDRPLDADYSIASQAEAVERALAALRIARPTIVGVDAGGGVAQRLAVMLGNALRGLVLINSVAFEECPAADVKAVQRATARSALRITRGVLGAAPLLREVLERSVANPDNMPERLIARYLAPYAGRDGVTHLLTLARSLRAEDLEGVDVGSIRAPTTVIWGDEDPWLDSGLGERLHGAIPGSTLLHMPGVGRLVPEEAPDVVARIVAEMLGNPGR